MQNRARRAVLVEDLAGDRRLLEQFLEDAEFKVQAFRTGEEALEHLTQAGAPDLIVVDYMLPGMSGLEVVQKLRDEAAYREAKILIISAKADSQSVESMRSAGADDYAFKPINRSEFAGRLSLLGFE